MAYPNTIANDTPPDGDKVQENFNYVLALVAGGAGIKTGSTMAQLVTAAAAAPTVAFLCIPSDLPGLMIYIGSATGGPDGNGFVTIVTWQTIS